MKRNTSKAEPNDNASVHETWQSRDWAWLAVLGDFLSLYGSSKLKHSKNTYQTSVLWITESEISPVTIRDSQNTGFQFFRRELIAKSKGLCSSAETLLLSGSEYNFGSISITMRYSLYIRRHTSSYQRQKMAERNKLSRQTRQKKSNTISCKLYISRPFTALLVYICLLLWLSFSISVFAIFVMYISCFILSVDNFELKSAIYSLSRISRSMYSCFDLLFFISLEIVN